MNGYHKNGSKLAPSNYLKFICISFNSIQIFTISLVLPKFHPILWNSESNINKFPYILIFRLGCVCHLHALSDIVVCWQCFPWRPHKLKYWFSHKSGSRSNTAKPWFYLCQNPSSFVESLAIKYLLLPFIFFFVVVIFSISRHPISPSTLSPYIPHFVFPFLPDQIRFYNL